MTYDTQDGKNLIIRCFCSSKKVSCVWFGSCEHSLVYSSGICIDFVCEVEEEEDKEKKKLQHEKTQGFACRVWRTKWLAV